MQRTIDGIQIQVSEEIPEEELLAYVARGIGKILTLTIGARISFATLPGRQNIRRKIL